MDKPNLSDDESTTAAPSISSGTVVSIVIDDPVIVDRWRRVQDFVIDDQSSKGTFFSSLSKDRQWDNQFAELAIGEYKKFMLLQSLFPDRKLKPSTDVDSVWHLHLLYSVSYHRFCREALDCDFVHHDPSKGGAKEKEIDRQSYQDTLQVYVDTFGLEPPPEIWGRRSRALFSAALSDLLE